MIDLFLYAAGVVWVARTAEARGRCAVGWAMGMIAFALLVATWWPAHEAGDVFQDDTAGDTFFAWLAPRLVSLAAMAGVALALRRLPIKISSRRRFPIDDLSPGAGGDRGRLTLDRTAVRLDVAGITRLVPHAQLSTVQADGQCLRLMWEDGAERKEAVLLPRGKPDTVEGRRAQSQALAARIRGPLPVASVHVPRSSQR